MAEKQTGVASVVIVGIGNLLLRDEGVGIHVINELLKLSLPDNIEVVDGGTSGADLIDTIADRDKVIVVDAMKADDEPGAVFRLTGEDLAANPNRLISMHEFGLTETLAMARQLNCSPKEVIVYGVQPETLRPPGMELSETIAKLLPRLVKAVLKEAGVET
jgi:hydrogenase maturation protease